MTTTHLLPDAERCILHVDREFFVNPNAFRTAICEFGLVGTPKTKQTRLPEVGTEAASHWPGLIWLVQGTTTWAIAFSADDGAFDMFERVRSEAGRIFLHLGGSLDGDSAVSMREGLSALAAAEPDEVVIDLSHVTFIDGSGLGALSFLFKRLTAQGGRISMVGAAGQPLAMIRQLGLTKLLGLKDSPAKRPYLGIAGLAWAR